MLIVNSYVRGRSLRNAPEQLFHISGLFVMLALVVAFHAVPALAVDSVAPSIIDNQTGDNNWYSSNPGAVFDVDFTDTGGSNLSAAYYTVWSAADMSAGTGTEVIAWTAIATTINTASYTLDWAIDFDSLPEGTGFVSAKAVDGAANESPVATDAFYVIRKNFITFIDTNQELGASKTVSLIAADLDSDGDRDLVEGNLYGEANAVWLNDGNAVFTSSGQHLGNSDTESVLAVDYDMDGDLDIIAGNTDNQFNKIWRNDGSAFFTDIGNPLGMSDTWSVVAVDLDSDGDMDLIEGNRENDPNRIYFNNGSGAYTLSLQELGAFQTTCVSAADLDGDGDIDFAEGNVYSQYNLVWLNDGAGNFTDSGQQLSDRNTLDIITVDVDGDGDYDIVNGNSTGTKNDEVWLNDGSGNFTDSGQDIGETSTRGIAAGDIDGDGDMDLVQGNYAQPNTVQLNNGSGVFSGTGQEMAARNTFTIYLADLDNDGDLDYVEGTSEGLAEFDPGLPNYVWLNTLNHTNDAPAAPAPVPEPDMTAYLLPAELALDWAAGSDTETTDTDLLSYDIRLGTTSGGCEVFCGWFPSAGATPWTGSRPGNAGATTSHYFDLATGTYFWSARTIDSSMKPGPWSAEDTFTITKAVDSTPPVISDNQAGDDNWYVSDTGASYDVDFSDSESKMFAAWYTIYSGPSMTGSQLSAWATITANMNVATYTTNWPVSFGALANGLNYISVRAADRAMNYSVATDVFYVGVSSLAFADSGQSPGADYVSDSYAADADGDGDADVFTANSSDASPNLLLLNNSGVLMDSGQTLGSYKTSSVFAADIDNDGDLDAIFGNDKTAAPDSGTTYWKNNGAGIFSASAEIVDEYYVTTALPADIDSDGDLDLILAVDAGGGANLVYTNDGAGTFTDSGQTLGTYTTTDIAAADIDADGDNDLIEAANGQNRIWTNTGAGVFSDSGQTIGAADTQTVCTADFDGDSDIDFVAANSSSTANKIYLNNGGVFAASGQSLGLLTTYSVAAADADGDGDIDLFEANAPVGGTKVWLNNGAVSFTDTGLALGFASGAASVAIADYDGDGDIDIYAGALAVTAGKLWINGENHSNATPVAPTATPEPDVTIFTATQSVTLAFSAGSDAETADPDLLSYDIRIGTTAAGCEVFCGWFANVGASPGRSSRVGNAGAAGSFTITVATGTYYWQVRTVDTTFRSSAWSAQDSFLINEDTQPPVITDNQPGIDTWYNSDPSLSFNVDFSDSDGSHLKDLQYTMYSGAGMTGAQLLSWTDIATGVGANFYTTDWSASFAAATDGVNFISVRATDYAGNAATSTDVFYIKKDTASPTITDSQADLDSWFDMSPGSFDIDFSDTGGSLLSSAQYTVYTQSAMAGSQAHEWTDIATSISNATYTTDWTVNFNALPEGSMYVSARALDNAGNYSTVATDVFFFKKDISSPSITDNQAGDATWRRSDPGPIYDVDFSDTGSLLDYAQYSAWTSSGMSAGTGALIIAWTNIAQNIAAASYNTEWGVNFTVLPQGDSFISVRAVDAAGHTSYSTDVFYVQKDTVPPAISDNQPGDDTWYDTDPGAVFDIDFSDSGAGLDYAQYSVWSRAAMSAGTGSQIIDWATVAQNIATGSYTANWAINFSKLPVGTSYVSVRAADQAGNVSTTATDVFYVKLAAPSPYQLIWESEEKEDFTQDAKWGDCDGDGDLDIIAGNYFGELTLYENAGGDEFSNTWTTSGVEHVKAVEWGDLDGDGDLDFMAGRLDSSGTYEYDKIFINDGTCSFTTGWTSQEQDETNGLAVNDFDADGYLDIFISNDDEPDKLYLQNGPSSFSLVWMSSDKSDSAGLSPGDFDNDGDMDVLMAVIGQNFVYSNNGDGTFSMAWTAQESDYSFDVTFVDYDENSTLDIAVANQYDSADSQSSSVYTNNGDGTFALMWNASENEHSISVAYGDYDGDGAIDLAFGNHENEPPRIYSYDGGSTFTSVWAGVADAKTELAFGDYDGDGDLDLLAADGVQDLNSMNYIPNRVYKNNLQISNDPPVAPVLTATPDGETGMVTLQWNASSDDISDVEHLTYQLRVGACSGCDDVMSGQFSPPAGNVGAMTGYVLRVDNPDVYYWSVKAIDAAGFQESAWSAEDEFQLDTATFELVWSATPSEDTFDMSIADYDGDGDMDVLASDYGNPERLYRNDNMSFNLVWTGEQSCYHTKSEWADYDADGDLDYAIGTYSMSMCPDEIVRNDGDGDFSTAWTSATSQDNETYSLAWADFDRDGDLDFMTGDFYDKAHLYQNRGNNNFVTVWDYDNSVRFTRIIPGDFDSDGFPDIAVTRNDSGSVPIIFRNQGDSTFAPYWTAPVHECRSKNNPVDYDNDGDLDLFASGCGSLQSVLYQSDGAGSFSAVWSRYSFGNNDWADYDGDGVPDILSTTGSAIKQVYRNNGGNSFTIAWESTPDDKGLFAFWGDLDRDGDQDIISWGFNRLAKAYRNNLNPANSAPSAPVLTPVDNMVITSGDANVTLAWSAGTDDTTPASGLNYHYRIGTCPGCDDVAPSLTVHYRNNAGPMLWSKFFTASGTYYWAVRAYDSMRAPGAWSAEDSFVISVQPESPVTFELSSGWNLIGASSQMMNFTPSSIFATGAYELIAWNSGYEYFTDDFVSFLIVGEGYWMYSQNDLGEISLSGIPYESASRVFSLSDGWNLIADPYENAVEWNQPDVSLDCGSGSIALPAAYGYNNENKSYEIITPAPGSFILPWTGYWIKVSGDCVLTISKP